ncbi:MAG: TolC family protein [Planctomycetota bacterium]
MFLRRLTLALTFLVIAVAVAGCRSSHSRPFESSIGHYESLAERIDYPDVEVAADLNDSQIAQGPPPTVRDFEAIEYRSLTLEEAVQLAIENNETVRQMGGVILRSTAQTSTIYDPAIQETDPRFGTEAALAAFDAQANAGLTMGRRERQINLINPLLRYRTDNVGGFNAGIGKVSAAGTEFRVDTQTTYLRNDWRLNRVPSVFESEITTTVRHPLLQGGGVEFNRIAGPGSAPGVYRGVMIARVNNDVALVDFQTSVRNLLRDVERQYWELYFSYRDLDAKLEGRRYALESWELEKKRVDAKLRPADQEAYAREQYYFAQSLVENAISGERGQNGVLSAERELRSLIGLPATDGKLLRPVTPPLTADIRFDWWDSLGDALVRREELRRQRWKVKQRELELLASRNFTLPRLNVIGQYALRGFGDDLVGQSDAALDDLFAGHMPGFLVGMEYQSPIGRRVGHAAVRNAELLLRREKALLSEQERQIGLELRGAFTELDRAYVVTRSNYNRHIAAQIQLEAQRKRNAAGDARLDLVLEVQRQAVVAEVAYHRSVVDFNQAVMQVNLARGSLLGSLNVELAEGPWSAESHASAAAAARRFRERSTEATRVVPEPVSVGPYAEDYPSDGRPLFTPRASGSFDDAPPVR